MSESATIERDPEQRLRAKSAAELLGIGLSTWWAWVKAGKAPESQNHNLRHASSGSAARGAIAGISGGRSGALWCGARG